ncbi:tyrosinase precursor like protein [Zymoseptoria brevis]|uniref:tyrosinase n=1 Tax=Zymoseptoria brevis TaxID=1047168 RepID=A0A0F4G9M2_9PEZI|nr:tyrosinase precursor like protein [Zymoseptoria brevis]
MASIPIESAQKDGVVVGLKHVSGVQPRLEIDDLMVNHPDVFNLFILALQQIMQDESDGVQNKMNYFEVAGIHGFPRKNWDGVQVPGSRQKGSYCTHSSFLFPTWHRPYLALFEQTLYSAVQDIAAKFSDEKYHAAAKQFRLPYWDWIKPRQERTTEFPGQGQGGNDTVSFPYSFDMPLACQKEQLRVYQPGDETNLVSIANPLLTYHFPKKNSVTTADWKLLDDQDDEDENLHRQRTVRDPPSGKPDSDGFQSVNNALNMMRESSVELALSLMASPSYDKYVNFAAGAVQDEQGADVPSGSLEDLHNTYHGLLGGQGHMGRVPVAAFDPIFWLHHANVDRLLSVWQAIHKDSENSFLPAGDEAGLGEDAKLWPFRKTSSNTDMWTSKLSKETETFGYSFADVLSTKEETLNHWNESYRWSLQSNNMTKPPTWMEPIKDVEKAQALSSDGDSPLKASKLQKRAAVPHTEAQAVLMALPDEHVPQVQKLLKPESGDDKPVVQWYADAQVQRNALNGAFTIFFFLATPSAMATADADPQHYSTAPTMAGLTKIFTAPKESCANCEADAEDSAIVTGTSPITPMLRDYIRKQELAGLAPEQVVPFLKERLYWRVLSVNGVRYEPDQVAGLKVEVSATMSVVRPGGGLASWEPHVFPEVVEGRTGGDPVAQ